MIWRRARALVVAFALQVGVNYANDYSDGVRGTDRDRQARAADRVRPRRSPRRSGAPRFLDQVAAAAGVVLALIVEVVAPSWSAPRSIAVAVALHRRAEAVRLSRPRRSHGPRPSSVRRDHRLRVRAAETACRGRHRRGCRGRPPGVRDPPRQQRPRRPDRPRTGKRTLAVRVGVDRPRCCSSRATSARSVRSSRSESRSRGRCSVWLRCRSRARCVSCSHARIRRRWSPRWSRTSKIEVVVAVLLGVGLCLS